MAFVKLETQGAIATVTIDRPDKLNALDADVLCDLVGVVDKLHADKNVRCVILTGSGKAFVAGADIAAMTKMAPAQALEFGELGHRAFDGLENLHAPVIAAVNGFALGGGCELALACDFIYASDRAKFGQPEVKLGVIPGFGGTQRLSRRVGVGHARELIYTGTIIDAAEALRIGLANAVVAGDELLAKCKAVADTIAGMGPRAVAESKSVISRGADIPLRDANALEREAFARCFSTPEQKEGMAAFLEKRAPKF